MIEKPVAISTELEIGSDPLSKRRDWGNRGSYLASGMAHTE